MRFIHKLNKIDSIVNNGSESFSLGDLPTDYQAQDVLVTYFISIATEDRWLYAVQTVFNKYYTQYPSLKFSYLKYLEEVSGNEENNITIANASLELTGLEMPDWFNWLRLIKKLGWQSAIPLIERFLNEVPRSRIDGLTREMADLVIRALEQGNIDLGLRLLDKILRFVPIDAGDVKSPKQEYLALLNKPEPPISAVTFSEVVNKVSMGTPPTSLFPVFKTLCELLNDAIDLSVLSEEREDRSGDDGSSYWRPAIETNKLARP